VSAATDFTIIPEGAVFYVSTGEYSSYEVIDVCRALKQIDLDSLRKEYGPPLDEDDSRPPASEFCAWLKQRGYLESLPHGELFLDQGYTYGPNPVYTQRSEVE
jgi:hypothetical protein